MSTIKVGDVFPTREGGRVVVIRYDHARSILVRHMDENKHEAIVMSSNLRVGAVKNPYHRKIAGVGYFGVGEYKSKEMGKYTPAYRVWKDMIHRVYTSRCWDRYPTYKGCSVCDEWHSFQTFAGWYYRQPNACKAGFALDKDLKILGSREYSPKTCSIIPHEVNTVLGGTNRIGKGVLPLGVRRSNAGDSYSARINIDGKNKNLGKFSTVIEAYSAYKEEKERQVRAVARRNKDVLCDAVYNNLMRWELEDL